MTLLLLLLINNIGGNGPQFALPWIFWVAFALWIFLGFRWYWRGDGAPGRWIGPGNHAMITLFIFLLGWGIFGLPGIGR